MKVIVLDELLHGYVKFQIKGDILIIVEYSAESSVEMSEEKVVNLILSSIKNKGYRHDLVIVLDGANIWA